MQLTKVISKKLVEKFKGFGHEMNNFFGGLEMYFTFWFFKNFETLRGRF
jgi:hypothetical protein